MSQDNDSLLLFSRWVVSDSLQPCELQQARLFCPPLSPAVCSNSYPLSQGWDLTISSSARLLSFSLQLFPASGSFPMSWLFTSGGQSIGASASASALPMNIQDWFPLEQTGLISLQSKGLSSLLQLHNSKASILWCSAFFVVQLSHPHMTTGKTIALLYGQLLAKWYLCFLIECLGLL